MKMSVTHAKRSLVEGKPDKNEPKFIVVDLAMIHLDFDFTMCVFLHLTRDELTGSIELDCSDSNLSEDDGAVRGYLAKQKSLNFAMFGRKIGTRTHRASHCTEVFL